MGVLLNYQVELISEAIPGIVKDTVMGPSFDINTRAIKATQAMIDSYALLNSFCGHQEVESRPEPSLETPDTSSSCI